MTRQLFRRLAKPPVVGLVLTIAGCATVPPPGTMEAVSNVVKDRTGARVRWRTGSAEDRAAEAHVRGLLGRPLSVNDAVQVALLSNPALQAEFEEVGIAQAEVVQAGLLTNPSLGAAIKFPDRSPRNPHIELGLSQNLVELFLLPLRKRLANLELQQAELSAGAAVLDLVRDTKVAYWKLWADESALANQKAATDAARASAELADRLWAAGNISELEQTRQQAVYQQAEVELQRLRLQADEDRRELARLMGRAAGEPSWRLAAGNDAPVPSAAPGTGLDAEQLAGRAFEQRLELDASRRREQAAERNAGLVAAGLLTDARVGLEYEHDADRTNELGPSVDLELPIFDQRQARKARAAAVVRQARRRTEQLRQAVASEVRLAADRAASAQALCQRYDRDLLPLRQKQVHLAQLQYNAMTLGPAALLEIKRDELADRRRAVEAQRDYWIAMADLEHSVGGILPERARTTPSSPPSSLPSTTPSASPSTASPAAPAATPAPGAMEHHHH